MNRPSLLLSVPWTSPFLDGVRGIEGATVLARSFDLGVGRSRKARLVVRDALRIFRASREHDATVVCTTMAELVVLALLMRVHRGYPLVAYDFLLPRNRWVRRVASMVLRRVDLWLVIRRGDAETFASVVGARRCAFVPFPVADVERPESTEAGYVYAAGTAYRDWATLMSAMEQVDARVVLSTNGQVPVPAAVGGRVDLVPIASPERGRELMARATAVCIPFVETMMPSGPLIVLDALRAGKPLVVTDVNGTRDYVTDGLDALVVPPGDASALAAALDRVLSDGALRRELGDVGRRRAALLTPALVVDQMRDELHRLNGGRPSEGGRRGSRRHTLDAADRSIRL